MCDNRIVVDLCSAVPATWVNPAPAATRVPRWSLWATSTAQRRPTVWPPPAASSAAPSRREPALPARWRRLPHPQTPGCTSTTCCSPPRSTTAEGCIRSGVRPMNATDLGAARRQGRLQHRRHPSSSLLRRRPDMIASPISTADNTVNVCAPAIAPDAGRAGAWSGSARSPATGRPATALATGRRRGLLLHQRRRNGERRTGPVPPVRRARRPVRPRPATPSSGLDQDAVLPRWRTLRRPPTYRPLQRRHHRHRRSPYRQLAPVDPSTMFHIDGAVARSPRRHRLRRPRRGPRRRRRRRVAPYVRQHAAARPRRRHGSLHALQPPAPAASTSTSLIPTTEPRRPVREAYGDQRVPATGTRSRKGRVPDPDRRLPPQQNIPPVRAGDQEDAGGGSDVTWSSLPQDAREGCLDRSVTLLDLARRVYLQPSDRRSAVDSDETPNPPRLVRLARL